MRTVPWRQFSYEGGRVRYGTGACDGFLRSGRNDRYAIGYYTAADLAFFGQAARDHVPPSTAPDPRPDLGTGLRGFRVPCLVISPRARRRTVAHGTYDHTSILKMIEWRFGLEPLTVRDAGASNLAEVLDFEAGPDLTARRYDVPDFRASGCRFTRHTVGDIHAGHDWPAVRNGAVRYGYLPVSPTADQHLLGAG